MDTDLLKQLQILAVDQKKLNKSNNCPLYFDKSYNN